MLLLDPTEGWVADLATGALERSGRLALPRETYTWPALVRLAGGEIVAHGLGAPYPERFTP